MEQEFFSKDNLNKMSAIFAKYININDSQTMEKCKRFMHNQMKLIYQTSNKPTNLSKEEYLKKLKKQCIMDCIQKYRDRQKEKTGGKNYQGYGGRINQLAIERDREFIGDRELMVPDRPRHTGMNRGKKRMDAEDDDGIDGFSGSSNFASLTAGFKSLSGDMLLPPDDSYPGRPQDDYGRRPTHTAQRTPGGGFVKADDERKFSKDDLEQRYNDRAADYGPLAGRRKPDEPNFRLDGGDSRMDKFSGGMTGGMTGGMAGGMIGGHSGGRAGSGRGMNPNSDRPEMGTFLENLHRDEPMGANDTDDEPNLDAYYPNPDQVDHGKKYNDTESLAQRMKRAQDERSADMQQQSMNPKFDPTKPLDMQEHIDTRNLTMDDVLALQRMVETRSQGQSDPGYNYGDRGQESKKKNKNIKRQSLEQIEGYGGSIEKLDDIDSKLSTLEQEILKDNMGLFLQDEDKIDKLIKEVTFNLLMKGDKKEKKKIDIIEEKKKELLDIAKNIEEEKKLLDERLTRMKKKSSTRWNIIDIISGENLDNIVNDKYIIPIIKQKNVSAIKIIDFEIQNVLLLKVTEDNNTLHYKVGDDEEEKHIRVPTDMYLVEELVGLINRQSTDFQLVHKNEEINLESIENITFVDGENSILKTLGFREEIDPVSHHEYENDLPCNNIGIQLVNLSDEIMCVDRLPYMVKLTYPIEVLSKLEIKFCLADGTIINPAKVPHCIKFKIGCQKSY